MVKRLTKHGDNPPPTVRSAKRRTVFQDSLKKVNQRYGRALKPLAGLPS